MILSDWMITDVSADGEGTCCCSSSSEAHDSSSHGAVLRVLLFLVFISSQLLEGNKGVDILECGTKRSVTVVISADGSSSCSKQFWNVKALLLAPRPCL